MSSFGSRTLNTLTEVFNRRRGLVLTCAALGVTVAYAHQSSTGRKIRKAVSNYVAGFVAFSQLVKLLTRDLQQFLDGDENNEVPKSFRQVLKLFLCEEAQELLSNAVRAQTKGSIAGFKDSVFPSKDMTSEELIGSLFNERTAGLLGVILGNYGRQTVQAMFEEMNAPGSDESAQRVLSLISQPKFRETLSHVLSHVSAETTRAAVHAGYEVYSTAQTAASAPRAQTLQVAPGLHYAREGGSGEVQEGAASAVQGVPACTCPAGKECAQCEDHPHACDELAPTLRRVLVAAPEIRALTQDVVGSATVGSLRAVGQCVREVLPGRTPATLRTLSPLVLMSLLVSVCIHQYAAIATLQGRVTLA